MSKAVSNVPLSKDALLKSYRKRLRDDIGSMTANFMEIILLVIQIMGPSLVNSQT